MSSVTPNGQFSALVFLFNVCSNIAESVPFQIQYWSIHKCLSVSILISIAENCKS